jgi:hypothetical protein
MNHAPNSEVTEGSTNRLANALDCTLKLRCGLQLNQPRREGNFQSDVSCISASPSRSHWLMPACLVKMDQQRITVKTLKGFRSQTRSGRKHELAKRVVELQEPGAKRPMQGPFPAACDIEGDDDLDPGGNDESETDAGKVSTLFMML